MTLIEVGMNLISCNPGCIWGRVQVPSLILPLQAGPHFTDLWRFKSLCGDSCLVLLCGSQACWPLHNQNTDLAYTFMLIASPEDSLRDLSRIPPPRACGEGMRDESLRESAGEAIMLNMGEWLVCEKKKKERKYYSKNETNLACINQKSFRHRCLLVCRGVTDTHATKIVHWVTSTKKQFSANTIPWHNSQAHK